ncbi:MAG: hypothetical protein ACKOCC_01455 [Actinomycetota bacterium]
MNLVARLVRRLRDDTRRAIDDTRRQAPGARMIGEFTVRESVRLVRRRLGLGGSGPGRPTGDGSSGPTAQ